MLATTNQNANAGLCRIKNNLRSHRCAQLMKMLWYVYQACWSTPAGAGALLTLTFLNLACSGASVWLYTSNTSGILSEQCFACVCLLQSITLWNSLHNNAAYIGGLNTFCINCCCGLSVKEAANIAKTLCLHRKVVISVVFLSWACVCLTKATKVLTALD